MSGLTVDNVISRVPTFRELLLCCIVLLSDFSEKWHSANYKTGGDGKSLSVEKTLNLLSLLMITNGQLATTQAT